MKKKSLFMRAVTNLDAVICGVTLTLCVILVNLNVIFRCGESTYIISR